MERELELLSCRTLYKHIIKWTGLSAVITHAGMEGELEL